MKGFIVGAGHEAQVFKNRLDRMEENVCRCGRTPSEVGEEFVSSEDEGRTELSYASAAGEEYMAPPVENSIPLCQEIGLVTFMFFFELLFSYVSLAISFHVSLTNLFSIILFPYLLITRNTQDKGRARFRFY